MNKFNIAAFVTAFALGACSTPVPVETAPAQPLANTPLPQVPPPAITRDLPLEPPIVMGGRACQLGTSCMDLDPRPFELCLVGTKHCVDKAREPVEVMAPRSPDVDPKVLEIRHE